MQEVGILDIEEEIQHTGRHFLSIAAISRLITITSFILHAGHKGDNQGNPAEQEP